MAYEILSILTDTFYWFFSPMDLTGNFFQAGLLLFITLLIIRFFVKWFIKTI